MTVKLFPMVTSFGNPIVRVSPEIVVSISFEVPETFNVSPNPIIVVVELLSAMVIDEFVKDAFPILDNVLFDPLIVLLVSVCVSLVPTTAPVGAVTVVKALVPSAVNIPALKVAAPVPPSITPIKSAD